MAQENENRCTAAIAFRNAETGDATQVIAATGVELDSVTRRTDVPGVPLVYEFDLTEAIADEVLVILTGDGPLKADAGGGTPLPNLTPINVQRAIGDLTLRRFWVLLADGADADCYVEFHRIAPLDAPRTVVTPP